jgi:hypothetical protein
LIRFRLAGKHEIGIHNFHFLIGCFGLSDRKGRSERRLQEDRTPRRTP